MENTHDVPQGSSPANSEVVQTQKQEPVAPVVAPQVPATPPTGSQTPSENLYAALAEERRLRKELEEQIKNLNTTDPSEGAWSDEGKILEQKISSLESKLETLEKDKIVSQLQSQYPALKEFSSEFNEFTKDYPRHKLENVAKLFLVEKGLLEQPRKGLEKPTGGTREPISEGLTAEEVKSLRENNPRKYRDLILSGQLKF